MSYRRNRDSGYDRGHRNHPYQDPPLNFNDNITQTVSDLHRQIMQLTEAASRGASSGMMGIPPLDPNLSMGNRGGDNRNLLISGIPDNLQNPDAMFLLLEKFGRVERVKILNKKRHVALAQMENPFDAERALEEYKETTSRAGLHHIKIVPAENVDDINMPKPGTEFTELTKDYTQRYYDDDDDIDDEDRYIGGGVPRRSSPRRESGGCIVSVSSLPDRLMKNLDYVCNLFGQYGDVLRIKIPAKWRNSVLVEYSKPQYVQNARQFLNEVEINGSKILVTQSKMGKLSRGENQEMNRDYTDNKNVHRFRHPERAAKIQNNLCSPTSYIHLSNLCQSVSNNDVKAFLRSNGFTVKKICDSMDRKGMALVQLGSPEEGLMALSTLHTTSEGIKPNSPLGVCIAFSKRTL